MDEFEHLKALLLQDTEVQLNKVTRRVDDPETRHKDVAAVLPHAIKRASDDEPAALQAALQQPVANCVETALNQTPKRFAKPLLPVMSQAIRNHFADVFKSLRSFLHDQQAEIEKQQKMIDELQNQLQQQNQQQQSLQGHLKNQQQQGSKQQQFIQQQQSKNDRNTQRLQHRLQDLEQQAKDMESRARELSTLLPDALRLAQLQETDSNHVLSDALAAPIEKALRKSIENDTQTLANALFPIMGPAIRRSIEESIKELLKQINETVEQSMSFNGMRWRLEAIRTGKPYTQVMLQHTLIYRVEQVFLIHKDSGLLMQHLYQTNQQTNTDADAVSAMLTAIQDFIHDSFSNDQSDELNSVEMGKYTVWLERGPYTVLACVILGVPPYEFRIKLREIQEILHQRYSHRLEQFNGDNEEIAVARPVLEPILQEKLKDIPQNRSLNRLKKSIFWLLLLGLLLWGANLQYKQWQDRQQGKAYIEALRQSAGIIITEYHWQDNILYIRGLRDPLAEKPENIAAQQNFKLPVQSYWSQYQDHDNSFKQKRLQLLLDSYPWPQGIEAYLKHNTLYLQGISEPAVVAKLKKELGLFIGITQINTNALQLDDVAQRFQNYIEQLQQTAGIMVLNSGQRNGEYFINGVRDPLAVDPDILATNYQLTDINSQWQPYNDLSPEFVLKRIKLQLLPPNSAKLSLKAGILSITGHAPHKWIEHLQSVNFIGVEKIAYDKLQNTDNILLQQAELQLGDLLGIKLKVEHKTLYLTGYLNQAERHKLESHLPSLTGFNSIKQDLEDEAILRQRLITEIQKIGHIYFSGGAILLPGQTELLTSLRNKIRLLLELNRYLSQGLILSLQGHTDQIGNTKKNITLSHQRASVVQQWLQKNGIDKKDIQAILPTYLKNKQKTQKNSQIRLQQRRVDFLIQQNKVE